MSADVSGEIKTGTAALAGAKSKELEPMALIDLTASMNWANSEGSDVARKDVLQEAFGVVVAQLAAADSQAAHEEEGGGLRVITFANGTAHDAGDINPHNLNAKWEQFRFEGTTYIMPGVAMLMKVYGDEFGTVPEAERPGLLLLVVTDGEAKDTAQFASFCADTSDKNTAVKIALLGYGADHDEAQRAYQQVASRNAHVSVDSFGSETNPQVIAAGLLKMLD